jgi:hypothetical protein
MTGVWERSWRVVSPPGSVPVRVPGRAPARRRLARRVAGLPSGTPVVITDRGPWSSRRSRRFARRAGVRLEREYAALPSLRLPAYLVEREPETVRYFCRALLAAPPGAGPTAAAAAGVARWVAGRLPAGVVAGLVPAVVGVGRRT